MRSIHVIDEKDVIDRAVGMAAQGADETAAQGAVGKAAQGEHHLSFRRRTVRRDNGKKRKYRG
jgi:hypothetical protein